MREEDLEKSQAGLAETERALSGEAKGVARESFAKKDQYRQRDQHCHGRRTGSHGRDLRSCLHKRPRVTGGQDGFR